MTRWRPPTRIVFLLVGLSFALGGEAGAQTLPTRLSDKEFWGLVTELSEPGGYFRSDNFLSNESGFQEVIPRLQQASKPDGVYLGVGPEQNFTYIVALKPRIAFILDIRRQNMLEHLLYKALIEMSPDRSELLSRLFARRRPAGLGPGISIDSLLAAYQAAPRDSARFQTVLASVRERIKRHGFDLTEDDLGKIEYVYRAFFEAGPDLSYSFSSSGGPGYGGRWMPTYRELMAATDAQGVQRSFLASEENYHTLRRMENDNMIVPLVGDFAGPKAIRAVGQYLRSHGAQVGAFYTSNVEQYLFQQGDDWSRFFQNVATLPMGAGSTFIRWISRRGTPGPSRVTMLCPIDSLLAAFRQGTIRSYDDVIQLSH